MAIGVMSMPIQPRPNFCAATIAVPHPQWVERPLAVVVPRSGHSPDVEELRGYLGEQFAKWWVPDAIVFTDSLPKTGTGKVLKLALRETYQGQYSQAIAIEAAQA